MGGLVAAKRGVVADEFDTTKMLEIAQFHPAFFRLT